jgi:hypothetical protein
VELSRKLIVRRRVRREIADIEHRRSVIARMAALARWSCAKNETANRSGSLAHHLGRKFSHGSGDTEIGSNDHEPELHFKTSFGAMQSWAPLLYASPAQTHPFGGGVVLGDGTTIIGGGGPGCA